MTTPNTQTPPPSDDWPSADPLGKPLPPRRWWIKVILQPLVLLAGLALALTAVGLVQRFGWLPGREQHDSDAADDEATEYICPMMCTPPLKSPGRCPVCDMQLVPAASGPKGDGLSVRIDPETRRILNIQTAPVQRRKLDRQIRAVGELNYDESQLKTISAYVDGRIETLLANYTGVVVEKGDALAVVYSPRLYAGQVELLLARRRQDRAQPQDSDAPSSNSLYRSARRRLVELGMTPEQIDYLETTGEADSRLQLVAPISGTVIEKPVVEGQYVSEGEVIYRLADLSKVWLMLRLFPEDAALLEIGQSVEANVQSLPGQRFTGQVEFVFPNVDPATRTVGVRVVIPNPDGRLRIGDFARASIDVPLAAARWLADDDADDEPLVVPRDAVLAAGDRSVAYVETEPGRFEIRPLRLGPKIGHEVVVVEGLEEGQRVATRGNFLIDSQMQLASNPSLIDPSRAMAREPEFELTDEIAEALEPLSEDDRREVLAQQFCPVTEKPLGSMGTPLAVEVDDQTVYICCEGCRQPLLDEPQRYLDKLDELKASARVAADGDAPRRKVSPSIPPTGPIELAPEDDMPDHREHHG